MKKQVLVVGCGFAGAVSARMLADAGVSVRVLEKRTHIAGNAYDCVDAHGVLIHEFGPHIFHTNSKKVFEYLSRFTDWRFYEHRVLAKVGEQLLPIPINRTTLNQLYGLQLSEDEVQPYLDSVREPKDEIKTSADVVLNSVGPDLCNKFFRGYTKKQWGVELEALSAGVAARIPTRTNDDDRYFTDTFQFMPAKGYTAMFDSMLNHALIEVETGREFHKGLDDVGMDHVIYTGPVDAYFDCQLGKLPYRSLRFEHSHVATQEAFQVTGTVNYPCEEDFTRITEFKYLTGQQCQGTSIVREFPTAEGDPYYPIPMKANQELYERYAQLADGLSDEVTFIGRLAQYRYYNMDQVVAAAMVKAEQLLERLGAR